MATNNGNERRDEVDQNQNNAIMDRRQLSKRASNFNFDERDERKFDYTEKRTTLEATRSPEHLHYLLT